MIKFEEAFVKQSNAVLNDSEMHATKTYAAKAFQSNLQCNLHQFADAEIVQQRAAAVRWKVIEHLEKHLIAFDANFIKNGGRVLWARDAGDAAAEIKSIVAKHGNRIKYEPGNLFTELELENDFIKQEYQLLTTADKQNADLGIVEARYIIAEPAAAVMAQQNDLASKIISQSKVVIILAAIDSMLPTLNDLNLFLPLTASYATDKQNFSFNKIMFGPKGEGDAEGPDELYVMLIDNGRSNLIADTVMRQANRCIGCNACNHVCPVFNTLATGANDVEHVYTGVMPAIEKPYRNDFDSFHFLSRSSTLCGACTATCPVKIDLHKLILHTRHKVVTENKQTQREQLFFYLWKQAMLKRDRFGFAKRMQKKLLAENLYEKVWGIKTEMPELAEKSFNETWREKMG